MNVSETELKEFDEASQAFEKAVHDLSLAERFAKEGEYPQVIERLAAVKNTVTPQHLDSVIRFRDPLAVVAFDTSSMQILSGDTEYYPSAHDAVGERLGLLLSHFSLIPEKIDDPTSRVREAKRFCWEFDHLLQSNWSLYRAKLKSERAKVTHNHRSSTPPSATPIFDERLPIWRGEGRIEFQGTVIKIDDQFAEVLEPLVKQRAMFSGELSRYGGGAKRLGQFVKKYPQFEPFVTLPRKRGGGGYRTTIQDGSLLKSQ